MTVMRLLRFIWRHASRVLFVKSTSPHAPGPAHFQDHICIAENSSQGGALILVPRHTNCLSAGLNSHVPRVSQVDEDKSGMQVERRDADAPRTRPGPVANPSSQLQKPPKGSTKASKPLGSSSADARMPVVHLRRVTRPEKKARTLRLWSCRSSFVATREEDVWNLGKPETRGDSGETRAESKTDSKTKGSESSKGCVRSLAL